MVLWVCPGPHPPAEDLWKDLVVRCKGHHLVAITFCRCLCLHCKWEMLWKCMWCFAVMA